MNETTKYGIIGTGVMGQEHIQNINIIDNAEVVAICDTNEGSKNKAKSLVKDSTIFYNNLNELISANIADAYICLLYTSPSPRDVEESRMPSSA